jgi:hypothetical protein
MQTLVHSFVTDKQFQTVAAVIVLDLVLGVAAAVKMGTFALSYVSNFARNDVLGKVFPFFVLHSFALVAGNTTIVIPGLDVSKISDATFALVTAAMVGSIISSLTDFGLPVPTALGRGGVTPPSTPEHPAA